jgi:hypothetical protein
VRVCGRRARAKRGLDCVPGKVEVVWVRVRERVAANERGSNSDLRRAFEDREQLAVGGVDFTARRAVRVIEALGEVVFHTDETGGVLVRASRRLDGSAHGEFLTARETKKMNGALSLLCLVAQVVCAQAQIRTVQQFQNFPISA